MRDLTMWVMGIPNQFHPWDILLTVEFVEMLQKKGLILTSKIDNS